MTELSVNEMVRRYFAANNVQVDQETERMIVEAICENKLTSDIPKPQFEEQLKFASLEDIANFVDDNR